MTWPEAVREVGLNGLSVSARLRIETGRPAETILGRN